MFDDGRFLQSIILEARKKGLMPTARLAERSRRAVSKPPIDATLAEGAEGGGGVRVFPPALEESLDMFREAFVKVDGLNRFSEGHWPTSTPGRDPGSS